MPKETRQSATEQLRAVSTQDRTFDFIASTFDIDSYGTRIDPKGWVLDAFMKNPVMCLQHDDRGYTGSNGLPIANVIPESIRVEGDKLVMKGRAPTEGTFPLADTVFNLVSQGFMRGVSVGFEPLEWDDVDEVGTDGLKTKVRIFRKQRLLEVSIVTIPSNDKALIQRAAKLNKDESVIRRMTEQVEQLLEKQPTTVEKILGTIKVVVQAEDEAAFDEQVKEIDKHRGYFEKKQPANREATRFLEKFYASRKETQPAEEVDAWKRMNEMLDETATEQAKPEEVKPEEQTPPATAVEAPQPEQKASVQVPIHLFAELTDVLTRKLANAGVEALRRGTTSNHAEKIIDGLKKTVISTISL